MNEALENKLMVKVLKKGNELRFRALGSSMFPFIRSGDLITVTPVKPDDMILGDIIFYQLGSIFVAHRLVEKRKINKGIFFITKGDFLPLDDEPVDTTTILGKVIKIERNKISIDIDSILWRINEHVSMKIPFLRFYNFLFRLKNSISKA